MGGPLSTKPAVSAADALERLKTGNERFLANLMSLDKLVSLHTRAELVEGQRPFATIVGCADSRAPAEILFDQGIGDLFVVRVAGNIVAPSVKGSVEFATSKFGTALCVVLGHSRCGAIEATIQAIEHGGVPESEGLRDIVDRIRPGIEYVVRSLAGEAPERILAAAIRENIWASANALRHGDPILEAMIGSGALAIYCAEYSLETGRVEILDAPVP